MIVHETRALPLMIAGARNSWGFSSILVIRKAVRLCRSSQCEIQESPKNERLLAMYRKEPRRHRAFQISSARSRSDANADCDVVSTLFTVGHISRGVDF